MCKKQHAFPLVFRGPPCSGNVFAAKSGPQSCHRAKSGKPNVSQLQETPLALALEQAPALLPPSRPPSSMLQMETHAKLLRPRQLFSKRCVTPRLSTSATLKLGGKGAQRGVPDLSTARVCHRRLQTLKLKHALARFMTSHTGASCTWSRSACFCCVFSVLIPLSSSYSVLIPVLIPVLIHDFAGRATRTKFCESQKKERMFLLLTTDSQKACFLWPCQQNRE